MAFAQTFEFLVSDRMTPLNDGPDRPLREFAR